MKRKRQQLQVLETTKIIPIHNVRGLSAEELFLVNMKHFFDRPELREFVKKKILLFGVDLDENKTFILYAFW